jgi:hypothetical protein
VVIVVLVLNVIDFFGHISSIIFYCMYVAIYLYIYVFYTYMLFILMYGYMSDLPDAILTFDGYYASLQPALSALGFTEV